MVIFYPLRPSPLILMILVSFLFWLGFANMAAFVLFAFFTGVITPLFIKFLFVILDHRANGLNGAPKLRAEMFQPFGEWRPYSLLFVIATLYFAISILFSNDHNTLGKVALLYCLVVLPSIIGILTMSRSIRIALSPFAQLKFINIIGFRYWLLLACIAMGGMLTNYLIEQQTTEFLIIFTVLYIAVFTFNWLGVMIFIQRKSLDYTAINAPEIKEKEVEEAQQSARTMCFYRACREYPRKSALGIILKYIENEEKDALAAHQWFSEELMQLENKGFFRQHGEIHINVLHSAGKTAMADLLKEKMENSVKKPL